MAVAVNPLHSVSECTVIPHSVAPKLTDLPNEVLVQILSHLGARSVLHLRATCCRLHTLTSDPVNWSTILWRPNNNVKDVHGLKSALRLSKWVVKSLSLNCHGPHFRLSKCIDQIITCRCLRSISLVKVVYTEKQIVKLLDLPELTYLHLDGIKGPFLKTVAQTGHQLKTLSLRTTCGLDCNLECYGYIQEWCDLGYTPPDMRITMDPINFKNSHMKFEWIFHLSHSIDHKAYLSVYEDKVPHIQFQFDPRPTLAVTHSLGLTLAANPPGSSNFSTAVYSKTHNYSMERNIEFSDICDRLTVLKTVGAQLDSDNLRELAGVLPNLVHLNVSSCKQVLSDLKGLAAVSRCCPKLKVLSLCHIETMESLEELWRILATMFNLRFLYLQISLIMEKSDPIPMPNLTAIEIIKGCSMTKSHYNIEAMLAFLAQLSSLEVFKFESMPPVTVFRGFARLLHACPNLTHLHISKTFGNKLTLPTDASCYAKLEQFDLHCGDFVFEEELACALAQSEKLCQLYLVVSSFESKGVIAIVNSNFCSNLTVFHIYTCSRAALTNKKARMFAKSLREISKKDGKMIDIIISADYYS